VFDATAGMTNPWIGSRPSHYRQQQLHPSRIIIEILEVSRGSHIINVPLVAGNNSSARLARAPSETLAAKEIKDDSKHRKTQVHKPHFQHRFRA
jgi:predicted transcriptional regulator